jgi:hypothetical protein
LDQVDLELIHRVIVEVTVMLLAPLQRGAVEGLENFQAGPLKMGALVVEAVVTGEHVVQERSVKVLMGVLLLSVVPQVVEVPELLVQMLLGVRGVRAEKVNYLRSPAPTSDMVVVVAEVLIPVVPGDWEVQAVAAVGDQVAQEMELPPVRIPAAEVGVLQEIQVGVQARQALEQPGWSSYAIMVILSVR